MAYSRWVEGSYWYVYWSSTSGKTKETQMICVDCSSNEYSYTDVKNNFDTVVKIMNSFECGIEAAEQLKDCFDAFIQDVDEKFN